MEMKPGAEKGRDKRSSATFLIRKFEDKLVSETMIHE